MRGLAIAGVAGLFVIGASAPALADHIYGGSLGDDLAGTAHSDIIRGGGGPDVLDGRGGDDYVYGGAGSDLLVGGPGWDEFFDGGGHDTANGGTGNDSFYDGPGEDILRGGPGNDYFGMDQAALGDRINCGPGRDTVAYDAKTNPNDVLINCERVWVFD